MEQTATDEPKLNILMIAPTMFFADYGCHVRIYEEAVTLQNRGHQVTILTYPNGRNIGNLDIRRTIGVPFNLRIEVGSSRHKIYLDALLGLKALWYVWRYKPDIIHGHLHEGGLIGWMLSKLSGVPLVFDFQGSLTSEMLDHNFMSRTSRWLKPLRWLERQIDHMGRAVLTSSTHAAQLLKNEYDVPAGRIHPTPDCVNPQTFNPDQFDAAAKTALKQALNIPTHKKLLVYAGLLTEYQGIGLLLRALHELYIERDDFHLLLMGFPNEKAYHETAVSLGIDHLVTFTGKMPYENLASYLALGDIAMAPKLSATEGNGKVLNYMSMGLPIVGFHTPVNNEYLGRAGLYAADRTASALADAIRVALNMSPQDRHTLGRQLRQRVATHFNWDAVGGQIEMVYRAVVTGNPHPAQAVVDLMASTEFGKTNKVQYNGAEINS